MVMEDIGNIDERIPISVKYPITELAYGAYLSSQCGSPVWVKREDALDVYGSGHKLRRLKHLIPTLVQQDIDTLVTIGSLQSNQTKSVAYMAHRLGMQSHILYGGDKPLDPRDCSSNYNVTQRLSDHIHWHNGVAWNELPKRAEDLCRQLHSEGRRPLCIASGISNADALNGSIELGIELHRQLPSDFIGKAVNLFACAGSGMTCLGLSIAAQLLRADWAIHGICIGETIGQLKSRVHAHLQCWVPSQKACFHLENITFHDAYVKGGYGVHTEKDIQASLNILKEEGIFLDMTYMLKTFDGMKHILKERKNDDSIAILVHSGGTGDFFNGSR
ncbi:1-aminocyclopropane-1-carboxylate deaminase/D-cysteine desulfhydrase [Pseudomonas sp. UBA6562]|uniref:1-aminocyclopropane-1-carboxylate deaminase/D-cysteine desulfhydrase n=1 Tax=Pseudomonas sp. UBA6562 TaxID=1947332 RepID=UPI0025E23542|nr:pyridoxal-phosphate dependent enzyme [Pseudomonas sp. UBA6562]